VIVLLYGDTKQDEIQRARPAAQEIVLDRIAHGGPWAHAHIRSTGWRGKGTVAAQ